MSRMVDVWERVEAAATRLPHAYTVEIGLPLWPVVPYRARVEATYLPAGHQRHRTDRYEGEGLTLAEALDALAEELEAKLAELGGGTHPANRPRRP